MDSFQQGWICTAQSDLFRKGALFSHFHWQQGSAVELPLKMIHLYPQPHLPGQPQLVLSDRFFEVFYFSGAYKRILCLTWEVTAAWRKSRANFGSSICNRTEVISSLQFGFFSTCRFSRFIKKICLVNRRCFCWLTQTLSLWILVAQIYMKSSGI